MNNKQKILAATLCGKTIGHIHSKPQNWQQDAYDVLSVRSYSYSEVTYNIRTFMYLGFMEIPIAAVISLLNKVPPDEKTGMSCYRIIDFTPPPEQPIPTQASQQIEEQEQNPRRR